jgi:hypothetical protein
MKRAARVVLEDQLPRALARAGWLSVFGGERLDRGRIVVETLEGCFAIAGPARSASALMRRVERGRSQLASYWRASILAEERRLQALIGARDWLGLREYLAQRLGLIFTSSKERPGRLLLQLTDRIAKLVALPSVRIVFRVYATLAELRLPHAEVVIGRNDVLILYRVVEGRLTCPCCGTALVERRRGLACDACWPARTWHLGAPHRGKLAGRFDVDLLVV